MSGRRIEILSPDGIGTQDDNETFSLTPSLSRWERGSRDDMWGPGRAPFEPFDRHFDKLSTTLRNRGLRMTTRPSPSPFDSGHRPIPLPPFDRAQDRLGEGAAQPRFLERGVVEEES